MNELEWEYTKTLSDGTEIRVNKWGGGTLGKSYDGQWSAYHSLPGGTFTGEVVGTGIPKTHEEVAEIYCDFMGIDYV